MPHTEEVSQDGQSTNAQPAKGSSRGDVSVQLLHHGGVTVATHHVLLFLQLLSNLFIFKRVRCGKGGRYMYGE